MISKYNIVIISSYHDKSNLGRSLISNSLVKYTATAASDWPWPWTILHHRCFCSAFDIRNMCNVC